MPRVGAYFKIPEDLLVAVRAKAQAEGITVTSIVVDAFQRYLKRPAKPPAKTE